jgi:hypothetical protein
MRHDLPARLDPRLVTVASWLYSRFRVPGLGWRFGLDPLLGLVPGLGDALPALLSVWFVLEGARLGLPKATLVRMTTNIAIDWLVGSIPVLGDLFDAAWKSNVRNLQLLQQHQGGIDPVAVRQDRAFVVAMLAGLAMLFAATVGLTVWLVALAIGWARVGVG